MKKTLKLIGLDCAHCAVELEARIAAIEGVKAANVSFVNQLLTVDCRDESVLALVLREVNNFEEVQVIEETIEKYSTKKILHIENLDCPVCAEALQSDLQKIKGVNSVLVDYVTQTITLDFSQEQALEKVVKTTNKFEQVRVLDGGMYETKKKKRKREWILLGLSGAFFLIGVLLGSLLKNKVGEVCSFIFYGLAYLTVGYPVLLSTVKNVSKGRIFDENFLMTIASIGAIILGELIEGVAVMFLYQLGETLQAVAVGSSRKSVAKLMELKSERATLLTNGEQKSVTPEALKVDDILLVKAGEKAPTDGVLLSEQATLDMKSLTGEAEPRFIKNGEEILSGSINIGGMYEMKVLRPYQDSAVGRILDMVENAASGKAKPEKFIAKFSKYYTPIVCLCAVMLLLFAPLIQGLALENRLHFMNFSHWLEVALTFLVISCPCALVISIPLTYFSGIGACAKNGILIKGATYLDVAARVNILAFDKTGTLTEGNFIIRSVTVENEICTEKQLLEIAACVEKGSAHLIAKAFENIPSALLAEEIIEHSGMGISAQIAGECVLVGNAKLLASKGVKFVEKESVYTLIYVAKNGIYLGCIEIGDTLRLETADTLRTLRTLGISRMIMLTGDNKKRAVAVANEVGMYEVNAELLPDEKLKMAQQFKRQGVLMYVGDGVNDAPVMMASDCAVSMGKLGSAAAIEASDVVLISDNLNALPKALKIAKKTRKIVMQNIVFSILMKVVFMAFGAVGLLPLWLAVFADVGVMLLAVFNSFRVRF